MPFLSTGFVIISSHFFCWVCEVYTSQLCTDRVNDNVYSAAVV